MDWFVGMLCGLCGNADGDRRNDMTTRDGEVAGMHEYARVGNSWIVPGKGSEDPACIPAVAPDDTEDELTCSDAIDAEARSTRSCGLLQSASGPFAQCHNHVRKKLAACTISCPASRVAVDEWMMF